MKVHEIAEIVFISTERVVNVLHTHLCMRKLYARWVPRLLTIDQKQIRVTTSEENLAYINPNPKEFLRRFVTTDETWFHHYTPESRVRSKQRPHLKKKKIFFQDDNVPSHTSNIIQAKYYVKQMRKSIHLISYVPTVLP